MEHSELDDIFSVDIFSISAFSEKFLSLYGRSFSAKVAFFIESNKKLCRRSFSYEDAEIENMLPKGVQFLFGVDNLVWRTILSEEKEKNQLFPEKEKATQKSLPKLTAKKEINDGFDEWLKNLNRAMQKDIKSSGITEEEYNAKMDKRFAERIKKNPQMGLPLYGTSLREFYETAII